MGTDHPALRNCFESCCYNERVINTALAMLQAARFSVVAVPRPWVTVGPGNVCP